jgi:putative RecB family exonuclease
MERKAIAVYAAVERACARDDFRPHRSRLCDWCNFQAYCPAWGGDPEQAVALRPEPVLLPA